MMTTQTTTAAAPAAPPAATTATPAATARAAPAEKAPGLLGVDTLKVAETPTDKPVEKTADPAARPEWLTERIRPRYTPSLRSDSARRLLRRPRCPRPTISRRPSR